MSVLFDENTNCWSVMMTCTVRSYVEYIRPTFTQRGNIDGQRDVLKTATAKRIRARMIKDIARGAVIPPVVLGVMGNYTYTEQVLNEIDDPIEFLRNINAEASIIDGMQRTGALISALEEGNEISSRSIRLEIWLAESVNALIYRMLVLNTGQVPWTLSRQLSVVYSQLLDEVRERVPNIRRLFDDNNVGRRVGPAEYSASDLAEVYIAFSTRKTQFDAKEALSDDFSKMDFIGNLSNTDFQESFYQMLDAMAQLDVAFDRFNEELVISYSRGRHIFDKQPARIGFMVAMGTRIMGRPGDEKEEDIRRAAVQEIAEGVHRFVNNLNGMNDEELREFLKLDILREVMDRRVGQVGRYERGVFFDAFKVLLEESFDLRNMEVCWRAHNV